MLWDTARGGEAYSAAELGPGSQKEKEGRGEDRDVARYRRTCQAVLGKGYLSGYREVSNPERVSSQNGEG